MVTGDVDVTLALWEHRLGLYRIVAEQKFAILRYRVRVILDPGIPGPRPND